MRREIELTVNGAPARLSVATHRTLLEVLRDDLGLTGAKPGCGEGECGACTVLVDGRPVHSCLMLAVEADGLAVKTVEGLADPSGRPHPAQEALVGSGGAQCGWCTPGAALSVAALLQASPFPSAAEVHSALSGHCCRCGTVLRPEEIAGEGRHE